MQWRKGRERWDYKRKRYLWTHLNNNSYLTHSYPISFKLSEYTGQDGEEGDCRLMRLGWLGWKSYGWSYKWLNLLKIHDWGIYQSPFFLMRTSFKQVMLKLNEKHANIIRRRIQNHEQCPPGGHGSFYHFCHPHPTPADLPKNEIKVKLIWN